MVERYLIPIREVTPQAIDVIKEFYLQVFGYAEDHGLATENISLFISPYIADQLGLSDFIFIEYNQVDLPVIRDNAITERKIEDGFKTTIYMGDKKWKDA